jgi:hypothetical protein
VTVKVVTDRQYDYEFPERYNWEMLDSHKLRPVAVALVQEIKFQFSMPPEARHLISGLRYALRTIAELADV